MSTWYIKISGGVGDLPIGFKIGLQPNGHGILLYNLGKEMSISDKNIIPSAK